MPNATPQDAQVILQLYDLRREPEMRKARDFIVNDFWPNSFEELQNIIALGSDPNRYFRQVFGYWEMAAALAVHGAVNEELFLETQIEMFFVFAKIKPFLADFRKNNPDFLQNISKLIARSAAAQQALALAEQRVALFRERLQKVTAAR